jgi:hypothetical protein
VENTSLGETDNSEKTDFPSLTSFECYPELNQAKFAGFVASAAEPPKRAYDWSEFMTGGFRSGAVEGAFSALVGKE